MRYGQTISEQGMGGKTTEAEGSANQGKRGLHVMFYHQGKIAKHVLQMTLAQRMHRQEQTMLKRPEETKDMGLDLALEVRVFQNDDERT